MGVVASLVAPSNNSANQKCTICLATQGTASRPNCCFTAGTRDPFQFHHLDDGKRWCRTQIKTIDFSFTWVINNFSLCTEKTGEFLKSSTFTVGSSNELKWCLKIFPKGDIEESKDYLALYLKLISCKKTETQVKYEFSVLNAKGEKFWTYNIKDRKFVPGGSWGFRKFIQLSALNNKANGLLPDDNLTILCEGRAAVDRVDFSGPSAGLRLEVSEPELSEDLSSLFENQEFSDVTLSAGGKNLRAHKAILAARSPVFAAMFQHNMRESQHNIVVIDDVDYEVLREMLIYMYTGKAQNITTMAEDLLAAANKYDLNGLKMMCEVALCSTLTIENAAELLVLADTHYAKHLKERAIRLINLQSKDVMQTPGWKTVSLTNPRVIIEAFEALASREVPSIIQNNVSTLNSF